MRKKHTFSYRILTGIIISGFFTMPHIASADPVPTGNNPDFISYENYQSAAKAYCDSPTRVWNANSAMVTIPQYPELSATAVNNQIERTKNLSNLPSEEKEKLIRDLDLTRIGNFSGFKTLEVARLQYRANMDALFSCALVTSRLQILDDLQSELSKHFTDSNSEIKQQLEKEKVRLERERGNLSCNSADAKWANNLQVLTNSATRQYCHYRYYLTYLETQLETDRANVEAIELQIGNGNGTKKSATTSDWINSYNNYKAALTKEIDRADTSLPRAFKALRDMEQAYPTHLMLTIIYDDYIRLRKNLSAYMNASTQLYLKAFNAQDANNR